MASAAIAAGGPERFRALDALRGIAALAIVLYHLRWTMPGVDGYFLHAGSLVDFFFVLSGFVIAANYRDRIRSGMPVTGFMWLRFWRLYPLFITVAFGLLMAGPVLAGVFGGRGAMMALLVAELSDVANLLSLVLFLGFSPHGIHLASWSVAVEFWLYLGFALVIRGKWAVDDAKLFTAIACGALMVMLACIMWQGTSASALLQITRGIVGFSLGVIVWTLRERDAKAIRWLHRPWAQFACPALLAIALLLPLEGPFLLLVLVLAYPAFAGLVLSFAADDGPVSRRLLGRPWQALGRWSYSIYLLHPLAIAVLRQLAHHVAGSAEAGDRLITGNPGIAMAVIAGVLAGVVLGACVTYRLIEEPFRMWSRRWLQASEQKVLA